jgi:hypothetical protein
MFQIYLYLLFSYVVAGCIGAVMAPSFWQEGEKPTAVLLGLVSLGLLAGLTFVIVPQLGL